MFIPSISGTTHDFSLLDDELILRGMLQPPGLRCRNTHEVQPQLVASSPA